MNTVKAGDIVKLQFGLGGDQGIAFVAVGYPATAAHACGAPGPTDADATSPVGKQGLSYDKKKGLYTLDVADRQDVEGHVPDVRPQARGRHVPLRRVQLQVGRTRAVRRTQLMQSGRPVVRDRPALVRRPTTAPPTG